MKRELLGRRPFEFSARVTLQLGRESISNSTVAVSELIKNSYDAEAGEVDLNFYLREHAGSALVISDDGHGMNVDSLLENWLKIGTDNKSKIGISKNGVRVLTGAKGLGRLGIDRLCKKLILYTKTSDMDHAIQLNIDWKRFENSNLSLSDIEHDIYRVELPVVDKYGEIFVNKNSSGTRMLLLGLKDDWSSQYLSKLENELRLLVSPFQAENEFKIRVRTKGLITSGRTVNSQEFLDVARWKVISEVDRNGFVTAVFTNNQKELDVSQDKVIWGDWIKGAGDKPLFGPIKCEFHFLPQDHDVLKRVKLSAKDLTAFMNVNRGFRIYRDHFRVRPYGEPTGKGDWLDIGLRKAQSPGGIRQGGWKIGPHQIIGAVLISRDENSILNDQANREGLVENEAFYQLRTYILKLIETFELLAHKDAAGDKSTNLSDELALILEKSKKEMDSALSDLRKSITSTSRKKKSGKKKFNPFQELKFRIDDIEKVHAKQKELGEKYLEELKKEKVELEEQKNTLSNLASLGILTVCFGHEVRQHSARSSTDAMELVNRIDDATNNILPFDFKDSRNIAISIRENLRYIENFSGLALKNIQPDKRTRKKINVPTVFRYVFGLMSQTLKAMGVEVGFSFNDATEHDFNVSAYEIDWESIVINLITNSLWAFESRYRDNRKIQVEFNLLSADRIEIKFRDSGIGLEEGMEEMIFLPMHSSKRDLAGNMIGTGMGLAIVKNHIVDHMGGTVRAEAKSSLGGAEFIFSLPVRA